LESFEVPDWFRNRLCYQAASDSIRFAQMSSQSKSAPRYSKPKILLIDCEKTITEMLTGLGLNVREGSFGVPYTSKPGYSEAFPVYGDFSFPNAAEGEIIIIDLSAPNPGAKPGRSTTHENIELSWRSRASTGFIDPRPAGAELASNQFDVVFSRGAIFVVFAAFYEPQEFLVPQRQGGSEYRPASVSRPSSVWYFLTRLRHLGIQSRAGDEMIAKGASNVERLVAPFLPGGRYSCVFSLQHWGECSVVATNKHGDAVAIATDLGKSERILILPQLADKAGFIRKLITDFLPPECPEFFPEFGSKGWVKEPEYELPKVLELNRKIEAEREDYERSIRAIEEQIRVERETNGWMQNLLTETGDGLVVAVKKALDVLGFTKVTDVDAERDSQGKKRREDLQILDAAPAIIVDVKGLGNCPGDPDIQQPNKHATMRMREWDRTDVISLFIVNQERNLPPLGRADEPFRAEMVTYSEDVKTGLLTTWDLYRLVRGHWDNGWAIEQIKPLFYKSGRILPVPVHYHLLGSVTEVLRPAFILVAGEGIKVGDRIALEIGPGFVEHKVVSLQVNDKSVDSAEPGTEIGIQTDPIHSKLKEGRKIYRVAVQSTTVERSPDESFREGKERHRSNHNPFRTPLYNRQSAL
jgi:hypothetical protein